MQVSLALSLAAALLLLPLQGARGPAAANGPGAEPCSEDRLEELRARVADASPRTRRSAVRDAARLGGRASWELVLRALADPEAEVADAAQVALAGLDDPALVGELLGRAGLRAQDPGVRRRAAEALGRVRAEVDARALAERLNQDDDRARRLLVWSVERLARERRLAGDRPRLERALVKLQRSKRDPALAADALLALAALGAEDLGRLAGGARTAAAPELRAAALLAALEAPLAERFAWSRALAGDADAGVRLLAVDALERLGTREALETLVDRLETERTERVRERVLSALQALSGRKHRFDPRPWRDWLETCPPGWLASERALPESMEAPTRAGGLATLEPIGERVCFLFDFSGSMWEELPDGRTPKQVVDGELRTALERLPEETEFNLIPYGHHPEPWRERLAPARKQNVRAALEFFEGCRLRGRGNVWEAFELALADPGVDSIVVLTDGYPTGGFHADMELIVPLFAHANRYRRVAVEALLVDASRTGARHWSELALASGGTCTEVALRR